MSKIPVLLLLLFLPGIITGQKAYDCLLKAKGFTASGKPDLAISLITETLASDQSDSRFYIERAEAKLAKGDYSGAILDFNIANKNKPNSGEFGLARIYSLKRDASTAVYHLERNLSSEFRKSEKEVLLDPAFSIIENTPEWRQFWKKDWYSVPERGISEVEYDLSSGKIEEAKNVFSGIKANYSGDNAVMYAEALISYSSGNFPDAVRILSALTNEEPSNEKYLRLFAKAQSQGNNPAAASATYSRLIELEIIDPGLLVSRAECFIKTGEYNKARADLERYLNIDPAGKTALSLAGKVESASGDNIKALSYFSKNLELHPEDPACYIDRANSYFLSKTWKLAINDYSMSLDLNPDNADAWLSKGIALLNSGKQQDACHDFQRSLKLGNKRAAEYISRNCIK